MSKFLQNILRTFTTKSIIVGTALLIAGGPFIALPHAQAATVGELRQQVSDLQNAINSTNNQISALNAQADSLKKTIAELDAQISQATIQIQLIDAKIAQLQLQLDASRKELDRQKGLLKASMRALYKQQGASTVELIVGNDNFSSFIDQQEYLERLKSTIQTSAEQIANLTKQIEQQQAQQQQLKQQQVSQKQALDSKRSDRASILAQTEGDEARYRSLSTSLQSQQAAINAELSRAVSVQGVARGSGGSCDNGQGNGGYAAASGSAGNVCNAPKDSILDWNGIENRECTSYAYWYFVKVEGRPLSVSGDAKYWATTASRPVDRNPEVGAIGVSTAGYYGHVMIIEAVGPTTYGGTNVPAGQVLVSSMNRDYQGHFGYDLRSSATLFYIH